MEKDLKVIMDEINIDMYGVCSNKVSDDYKKRVSSIIKKGYNCEFIKDDYLSTMDTNLYMKDCDGVIVIGVPYNKSNIKLKNNEAIFSSSSWGLDYHKVVKEKLDLIIKKLSYKYSNYKFMSLVDNHKLDERYFAYKAGIGKYGSNGLIINEKYGANIFLGIILTNYTFCDKIIKTKTSYDNRYEKVCPGKCISEEGINYNKCVSYLTQKKHLTINEESKICDKIYGCDMCTNVCPSKNINNPVFDIDDNVKINLDSEFNLSNKEFKKKYGNYSGSWRGKNIIKRNIELIKKNKEKR